MADEVPRISLPDRRHYWVKHSHENLSNDLQGENLTLGANYKTLARAVNRPADRISYHSLLRNCKQSQNVLKMFKQKVEKKKWAGDSVENTVIVPEDGIEYFKNPFEACRALEDALRQIHGLLQAVKDGKVNFRYGKSEEQREDILCRIDEVMEENRKNGWDSEVNVKEA